VGSTEWTTLSIISLCGEEFDLFSQPNTKRTEKLNLSNTTTHLVDGNAPDRVKDGIIQKPSVRRSCLIARCLMMVASDWNRSALMWVPVADREVRMGRRISFEPNGHILNGIEV
jgi:hypothetical protein